MSLYNLSNSHICLCPYIIYLTSAGPRIWDYFTFLVAKNYMKMKKLGPGGGARVPSALLDPPMPSNHICSEQWLITNPSADLRGGTRDTRPLLVQFISCSCNFRQKLCQTRMHSSRMRTGRSISRLLLVGGGGVCL